ncbi:hypothetical protein KTG55_02715 [Acinetobacter pittii]|uniref:hypothetical protein n=1 Tax=Acinetobacter pittii TaxID=48296 RepID=UPI0021D00B3D|nr:hypothetical protein [Acinetobacter pittii]MCU4328707.1 hypothetical protein [Acinetobacter pittii]
MNEKNWQKKEIVLCFNLENQGLKKFLTIKERKNNDLVIMPRYADHYREANAVPDNKVKINHQKYSVHCSPNSVEFNVCMHNLDLSDGTTFRNPHYTKTIKSNSDKLTALFFCRSPDLSTDRYKLSDKDQSLSLCLDEFNPQANTLYYGIFICSNNRKSFLSFKMGEQNYKTLKFSNFTVLIVWTYQYVPSHFSGAKVHFLSIDDKKLNREIGSNIFSTTEGFTGVEAKKLTYHTFNNLKQEFYLTLLKSYGTEKLDFSLFQLPFKKTSFKNITNIN